MLPVNVLVVEDEKTTRRRVGDMLEDMGYQTQLFGSAESDGPLAHASPV